MSATIQDRHRNAAEKLTLYECDKHNDPERYVTRGECGLCVEQALADFERATIEAVATWLESHRIEAVADASVLGYYIRQASNDLASEIATMLRSGKWRDET